jgi:hypothetical protein
MGESADSAHTVDYIRGTARWVTNAFSPTGGRVGW